MPQQNQSFRDYHESETGHKYKKTQSRAVEQIDPERLTHYLALLEKNGYVVIDNVLSKETLKEIRMAVAPLLAQTGRNFFEGDNATHLLRDSQNIRL